MQRVRWRQLSQPAPGVRILFDQGVPAPLRRHLTKHAVETASERRWGTLTDREMLDQAEANGIDLLVTTDRNLKHQQVLVGRELAILGGPRVVHNELAAHPGASDDRRAGH
jgi:hypothetical protein